MELLRYSQMAIEIWGGISCLFAVVILLRTKHYNRKGVFRLTMLLLCLTLLLVSDAGAWLFRGNTSDFGYYAVRIANFCTFFKIGIASLYLIKVSIPFSNNGLVISEIFSLSLYVQTLQSPLLSLYHKK